MSFAILMDNSISNSFVHEQKELKMVLIVNFAMVLIGVFAILMLKYLDEKH